MKRKLLIIFSSLSASVLGITIFPKPVFAADLTACFYSVFGHAYVCTYNDWFNLGWQWVAIVVVPLSGVMLVWAGFLWMTSAGDPEKIGTAKKIITGVVSGILLLVLARVFIVNVIGLPGGFWNIK
jgi:hypothetical protein